MRREPQMLPTSEDSLRLPESSLEERDDIPKEIKMTNAPEILLVVVRSDQGNGSQTLRILHSLGKRYDSEELFQQPLHTIAWNGRRCVLPELKEALKGCGDKVGRTERLLSMIDQSE
mgnify:CR=1 FL=1